MAACFKSLYLNSKYPEISRKHKIKTCENAFGCQYIVLWQLYATSLSI